MATENQQQHFPCEQCGADLVYQPGTDLLMCTYCGHENHIQASKVEIREYSFTEALRALQNRHLRPLDSTQVIKCPNCAAVFELQTNRHAGDCPFCGTPVVTETTQSRLFQPKSLLPFAVTEKQARESFDKWIGGLWFAPSALKDKARRDEKLLGIYIPYWTYDSHTDTFYRGERGTVYYERRLVTVMVDGRPQQQEQMVPHINWTPASGRIRLFFDDVLIGATRTLPRAILDRLEPWDLHQLVPYNTSYLSGFQSEIYQIDLDEGFTEARQIMDDKIYNAVISDIGGDQQRVHSLDTQHSATTFKHLLLPVWSAAFRYNGKVYRFVINGRNGKTQGERPYSVIKIALTALLAATCFAGAIYYMDKAGVFDQMSEPSNGYYYPNTYQSPTQHQYPYYPNQDYYRRY